MGIADQMQKLKNLVSFKKETPQRLEASAPEVSKEFNEGRDPISFELDDQQSMFEAFYTHKIREANPDISPEQLQQKAEACAEVHMDSLYPTAAQVARDRAELESLDPKLSETLRPYEQEKRVMEVEAEQEAYGQASDMADSQKQAVHADPAYASLMRETGQMQHRLEDAAGMTITLNENDLAEIQRFENECKDRIHDAVKETNPSILDVAMEAAGRGQISGSIEAARERNSEIDAEHAAKIGEERENIHLGAALDERRKAEALEAARSGDEKALDSDELHQENLLEDVMGR